jgi:hypothetical protein
MVSTAGCIPIPKKRQKKAKKARTAGIAMTPSPQSRVQKQCCHSRVRHCVMCITHSNSYVRRHTHVYKAPDSTPLLTSMPPQLSVRSPCSFAGPTFHHTGSPSSTQSASPLPPHPHPQTPLPLPTTPSPAPPPPHLNASPVEC